MPNLAALPLPIPVPPAVPAVPDVAAAAPKPSAPAHKPDEAKPQEKDFSKVLKDAQEDEPEEEEEPAAKKDAPANAALIAAPVLPPQLPQVAEKPADLSLSAAAPEIPVSSPIAEAPAATAAPATPDTPPVASLPFELLLGAAMPGVPQPSATLPQVVTPPVAAPVPAQPFPAAAQPATPAIPAPANPPVVPPVAATAAPAVDAVPLPPLTPEEQGEAQQNPALAAVLAALPKPATPAASEELKALADQLSDLRDAAPDLSPGLKDRLNKIIDALQTRLQAPVPQAPAEDGNAAALAQQIEKHLTDRSFAAAPVAAPIADAPPPVTLFHAKPAGLADNAAIAALKADAPAEQGADGNGAQNNNSSQQQPGAQAALPQQAAQQASQATAATGKFEQLLNNAPRSVSEQVVFHLKAASHDGNSRITIQLDPVELGKLNIRLDVGKDGKAGIVITADNPQALDLLSRDAAGLQRALADAGLKADSGSLSFNLRGEQQGGQQSQQQAYRQQSTYTQENDPLEEALNATALRTYTLPVQDGLDIRI